MSFFRNITKGLRSLFRKERVDQELKEELGAYLEMAAEEKMKQGMNRKDALRAVRLERGSPKFRRKSSALLAGSFLWKRCGKTCVSPSVCCANRRDSPPSRSSPSPSASAPTPPSSASSTPFCCAHYL